MPAQLVKRAAFGVEFADDDAAVFVEGDGAFVLVADGWPLFVGDEGPGEPLHRDTEIVQTPEEHVGADRADLERLQDGVDDGNNGVPPRARGDSGIGAREVRLGDL